MSAHPTVVWIDHQEARLFRIEADKLEPSTVRAPAPHPHRHPKGAAPEHNHPDDLHRFFHDVAHALEGAGSVLLVGPSTAKLQFFRYVHERAPALEAKVVGIETVDHPTDGQLVAYAKRYFGLPDRLGSAGNG